MNSLIEKKRADLERLCVLHHVKTLELFGSAAVDGMNEESDLDFLVEFQPMVSPGHADSYFGLLEDLEKLLGRPVDLVEPAAIQNPFFMESISRSRILLYAA
jgi:predicted nucleotidyltransferase